MFGKKIEHGYANHEEADHQRIPVTPFAKQRSSFFVHFLFINRRRGLLTAAAAVRYYLRFRLDISDATSNPTTRPMINPMVTRFMTCPSTIATTSAVMMATSLLRCIVA
jgi:hypothetical protein